MDGDAGVRDGFILAAGTNHMCRVAASSNSLRQKANRMLGAADLVRPVLRIQQSDFQASGSSVGQLDRIARQRRLMSMPKSKIARIAARKPRLPSIPRINACATADPLSRA